MRKNQKNRACVQNAFDDRSSTQPSVTLPDEAIGIPELLAKYTKGIAPAVSRQPVDHQTDNFDSPDWMKVKDQDLVEHDILREELAYVEEQDKKAKKRKADKLKEQSFQKPPSGEARVERPAGDGAAAPPQ